MVFLKQNFVRILHFPNFISEFNGLVSKRVDVMSALLFYTNTLQSHFYFSLLNSNILKLNLKLCQYEQNKNSIFL